MIHRHNFPVENSLGKRPVEEMLEDMGSWINGLKEQPEYRLQDYKRDNVRKHWEKYIISSMKTDNFWNSSTTAGLSRKIMHHELG
jgi:hypothetical protein